MMLNIIGILKTVKLAVTSTIVNDVANQLERDSTRVPLIR